MQAWPGVPAGQHRQLIVFLCARFLLQCLSFHRGQCFCPRSRSKRGTSTNSRRRDRNCCPALLLRNATSGWRVRRWPMPKALTGRLVLPDDSALILSLTDTRQRFVTYVLYSSSLFTKIKFTWKSLASLALLPRGLYFVIMISEERGKEATSSLGPYKALSLSQASLCVTKIKAAGNWRILWIFMRTLQIRC